MCLRRRSNPFGESGDSTEDSEGAVCQSSTCLVPKNAFLIFLVHQTIMVLFAPCCWRKENSVKPQLVGVKSGYPPAPLGEQ